MTATDTARSGDSGDAGEPPGDQAAPAGGDPEALERTWATEPGFLGWLAAVNHKAVGLRFMVTAFVFLLVGGVQALMIRTQLARPESDVLGPEAYNQTFTMHGTTMVFLFAVPMLEGLVMYLAPLMVGTRDMPFPRLNALGYWLYLAGGVFVYTSLFTGEVPDGGWFAYVPLTGSDFSPGRNMDFWLLGVTMVEVSGVVGAIEIIVLLLKQRAPGMTLSRIPLFVWSSLAMAFAMLFAFPVLIAASTLLELERKFNLPFFVEAQGGDPLLWQHLFWIFGHPDVYIMLLPAVGVVSTVVASSAHRPVVAYPLVVLSLLAIAFVSFGLWVHHMYATGIPLLASAFFTAASLLIAIPSGIQVFAWIATLWSGRIRWSSPLLFVLGFLVIFVLGGVTGVMVAVVPFDLQAHDTYFVVAHFHYVIIGGVVFPIFAALHYWWPTFTGRVLDEKLARWTFWLMFAGFNVGFMPQHVLGLLGMPRRVYTYQEGDGWEGYNLLSTVGGFVLGAGVLVFVVNAVRTRLRPEARQAPPWDGGTLEWVAASPSPSHNFEVLPVVDDLHPGWKERPAEPAELTGEVAELREGLRKPNHDYRETWATTPVDAEVDEVVMVPKSSLAPLTLTIALVVALAGLLYDLYWLAGAGLAGVLAVTLVWLWPARAEAQQTVVGPDEPLRPPAPARRPDTRMAGEWGIRLMALVVLAFASSLAFSNVYLMANTDWPPGGQALPGLLVPSLAVLALVLAAAAGQVAHRQVVAGRPSLAAGWLHILLSVVGGGLAFLAIVGWPTAPTAHAYGAVAVPMLGVPGCAALLSAAMGAVVTRQAGWAEHGSRTQVFAGITAFWSWFTAGLALLLAVIVVGVPHLL